MATQSLEILKSIKTTPYINQRILSENTGYSLGVTNCALKELSASGYLDESMQLTFRAHELFSSRRPKNAIILAAGFGMRMVPINSETPKALLEVSGEPLIERQIKQLHEIGVNEIYVVVGFMKEHFEYLIDEYGVKLIVNTDYAAKNSLHSLNLAAKYLSNTYVVPCDIWCAKNPFDKNELYSWYMVSDLVDDDSEVRVNRKSELVKVGSKAGGNAMVGITYLAEEESAIVKERMEKLAADPNNDELFWEAALYNGDKMIVTAKVAHSADVVEIDTYEQLRDLDSDSNHLRSDALNAIAGVMKTSVDNITDITVLKKGMTNRSFLFNCNGSKYIMRIPGEGTDKLINRKNEAAVYSAISGKGLCDDVVYIDPDTGYKITAFLNNVRVCDPFDDNDLSKCMRKLRSFHEMKLKVEHEFDIFGQIEFYEQLWNGEKSVFKDYEKTKANVLSLKKYIEEHCDEKSLTHIDAVPDNFLFTTNDDGVEDLQLTDWEYAGMQDPHVDIAMFCIYSLYERNDVDKLIDIYFENHCPEDIRIKIYCYIATCGLLWSNWCEYKRQLGVEFGEYSLRQYRYAKDYYRIAKELMRDA